MAQRSSSGLQFVTPMVARDRAQPHRAATPLELLFDLSFVVAVAQAAATLHHEVIEGHTGHGVLGYALVFFAIWWAWMNFTWFASAYDTDDVPYRLLTLVQIAGVLVLAAGVPAALQDQEFATVTYGYVVMRVALIAQWLRVAAQHRPGRAHAIRYAVGIAVVQAGWLARLALPENLALPSFLLLAAAELAVPIGLSTSWAGPFRGIQTTSPSGTACSRSSCSASRSSRQPSRFKRRSMSTAFPGRS
jgi:low temperature requirement protein LtrA